MQHFHKIASGLNIAPILGQLEANPGLWNQHPNRTDEDSPHYGVDDIWVRYRPLRELTEPCKFAEPHFAEFYPAWDLLPGLKPIVFMLMSSCWATYLGGILITRIPPGGEVKPHDDRGSWHAETMNYKVYVPLKTNEICANFCGGDVELMRAGEAWTFNNLVTHSVVNAGATERITLIVCMKVES